MTLVGPKGWRCSAAYGADGSGGVVVFPNGETVPQSWEAGWHVPRGSPTEAVVGSETSGCQGCAAGQACPLFESAASAYLSESGRPCPSARPTKEDVQNLGTGQVSFEDPSGIAGDGMPSGGLHPAKGVMTYYPQSPNGSWFETCTLPDSQRAICDSALAAFVSMYGQL